MNDVDDGDISTKQFVIFILKYTVRTFSTFPSLKFINMVGRGALARLESRLVFSRHRLCFDSDRRNREDLDRVLFFLLHLLDHDRLYPIDR